MPPTIVARTPPVRVTPGMANLPLRPPVTFAELRPPSEYREFMVLSEDSATSAAVVTPPEQASARWSTQGIRPQDAFAVWREMISSTFVPLAATPPRRDAFRASIDHSGGPDLQLSTVRADAHQIRRTNELIDRADDAYLMATVQVTGRSRVEQDGREIELVPGSMVFCDSTRPFGFTFADPFEQLVVQMPRTVLQARSGLSDRATQRATAVRLDPTGPISVITGFMSSLASASLRDPDNAAVLGQHALGLIGAALAMAGGDGPSEPDAHELARARVLEYLRANFVDPRLDADSVAHACHMSRRSLFRLFADAPLSLADELRRIRVDHACQLVRARPALPVADVAAASGFASETQLYRAFRTVLGMTLTAYRAGLSPRPMADRRQ
ncbi:helix-turn-helix domain-containing protein [Saccharopolyspora sp. K220]|uniref:AraC-like ligand-binding domain-containing protein n=1 Tax=Saccharopolyspora soli TaxID=2926618 RepID=UPI001F5AA402|nr:helix-turn-helix domain-containing protein [Saccharopolyspora soli]MCI2422947.1 helix-turn-helix domain-containing protein [Saccharopolyspora soli]